MQTIVERVVAARDEEVRRVYERHLRECMAEQHAQFARYQQDCIAVRDRESRFDYHT